MPSVRDVPYQEVTRPGETERKIEIGSWYLDEFGNPTREIKRRD
jgi:hypothetical protein